MRAAPRRPEFLAISRAIRMRNMSAEDRVDSARFDCASICQSACASFDERATTRTAPARAARASPARGRASFGTRSSPRARHRRAADRPRFRRRCPRPPRPALPALPVLPVLRTLPDTGVFGASRRTPRAARAADFRRRSSAPAAAGTSPRARRDDRPLKTPSPAGFRGPCSDSSPWPSSAPASSARISRSARSQPPAAKASAACAITAGPVKMLCCPGRSRRTPRRDLARRSRGSAPRCR